MSEASFFPAILLVFGKAESLPKCLQQPELGKAEAISLKFHLVYSHGHQGYSLATSPGALAGSWVASRVARTPAGMAVWVLDIPRDSLILSTTVLTSASLQLGKEFRNDNFTF